MSKFKTKEMKDAMPSKEKKKTKTGGSEVAVDGVDVLMSMYKTRTPLVLNDIKMNQPFGQGRGPSILEDIGVDYKTEEKTGAASLKGLCLDKITSDDQVGDKKCNQRGNFKSSNNYEE